MEAGRKGVKSGGLRGGVWSGVGGGMVEWWEVERSVEIERRGVRVQAGKWEVGIYQPVVSGGRVWRVCVGYVWVWRWREGGN